MRGSVKIEHDKIQPLDLGGLSGLAAISSARTVAARESAGAPPGGDLGEYISSIVDDQRTETQQLLPSPRFLAGHGIGRAIRRTMFTNSSEPQQ